MQRVQYTQRGRFPLRIFLMEIKFARFDSRRCVRKRPFIYNVTHPTLADQLGYAKVATLYEWAKFFVCFLANFIK